MKNIEWWRGVSTHMWRTYFTLQNNGFDWDHLTNPERRIYAICHHVFLKYFVASDQKILQMYFTTRWGDDQYAVEDYALKNNIPTKVIWMVIRRANRTVMEECGFLERKDNSSE